MTANIMHPGGGAAAADALPDHPFYPLGIALPGYIANEMSTIRILGIFAGTCVAVGLPTLVAINRTRPDLKKREVSTAMWFVLCGCIHLILEGMLLLPLSPFPLPSAHEYKQHTLCPYLLLSIMTY